MKSKLALLCIILLITGRLAWAGDSDGDGIPDLEENQAGTNPLNPDTDGDGAGDWYEISASFTDPNDPTDRPGIPYPLPKPDSSTGATNKPVKVFILMGQSNMVGRGLVDPIDTPGTLATIVKQQHKFTNLLDAANNWSVRMDVRYRGIDYNNPSNYLGVGQGGNTNEIGPELGFGHALGYYLDEPVLVIKSAMGGKNLGYNYLPPGSPRYTIDGTTYAGYGDGAASWPAGSNPPPPATDPKNNAGGWYDYNVSKAKEVLTNFNTLYPQYAAQGYQVAGFCWVQGEADAGSAIYTPRYESNLVNFINAVRADFGVTNAPFVAATLGQNGMSMTGNYLTVCNAQLDVGNPTKHPEFAGKVKSMDSRKYWRSAQQSPTPDGSQTVHYNTNAETYMLIGDALGRGMIDLLEAGTGNTPPVALAQTLSTAEDTALAITLAGTDAENSALTFAVATQPSHGTLSGTAPNLTYTPALNYTGSDSFTFTVNDGTDTSAPATVSIAVGTVNVPPVAVAQSLSTAEDTALAITLTGTDAENSTLTFAVATQPSHGTLSGTAPNLTYTPALNYTGSDSFTFTVNDGTDTSVPATVSITVNPVNDAPVALAQSLSTAKDIALAITLAGTDVENSALTFVVVTPPANGTLNGTAPNLTYTPTANYTGPDSFTFTVNDGTATSAPATVSITVNSTQILVWDGDTSVTWATGANWSGGTAPANSLITDIARFNLATAPSFQPTASSGGSINGLIFGNDITATATTTIATATGTSRLNVGDGGILMNDFSGIVNIGTAAATQGLRLGASQTWTNDSSSLLTVSSLGNNDTGDYTLTLAGAGSGGITLTNVVQDGSATNTTALVVNMNGSGITTLSGANTFTGGLTLTGGTLMLGNNAALGATASTLTITGGTIDVNAARSMSGNNAQNWNGDFTFAGSNTWGTGTGAVTMNASRQVMVNASTMTVGGAIGQSGSGYGLTKAGAGTLVLNVANTYTGETKVNEGLLRFTVATALPGGMGSSGGTSALTLNGGVVGLTTGGSTAFTRGLGTGSHQVQWTGSGGFAAISGGTHTVNLGGSAAGVTWASGNFVPDGASLILGHATAGNQINFANPIDFNSATRTIQVDNGSAATDAGITGALTNGGLRKTGEGTLSLTVVNTYNGGTIVDAGTLFMGNSSALGSTSGQLTVNGGALNMGNNSLTVGNLTGAGGVITGTSGTRTLTIGQGNNGGGNYQGSIQDGAGGTTALTKTGNATITLSGINTYSGATAINQGVVLLTGNTAASALTTVAAGATLAGTGTTGSTTVNGIISPGTGVGTLNAGAVIWNGAATPGPATDWRFDLATPAADLAAADAAPVTACDRLNLTGDLTKGSSGAFRFDFGGYGGAVGWFKLVEWTGSTGFTAADFSATNLGAGKSAAFTVDAATMALYVEITGSDGPAGYALWQQINGATGQTPDQDHDGDGVENGVEYFVGGTTGFTALPGVVGDSVIWPKSASYPGTYGTTYKLQTSNDLAVWADVPDHDQNLIKTESSVGYKLLPAAGANRFVRLTVIP